jgi:hypothetical protein
VLTQTFSVPVTNDALNELTENFTVNLSGALNARIADAIGVATILDDDPPPSLSIDDVTVAENAGPATFTVTLSTASSLPVTVNFATGAADGDVACRLHPRHRHADLPAR